ncbi:MAG: ABC transporter ATP-binding protein [Lachnospiraceae bacterium]|nr:ABC transporter ATP-binding protein [Lachnospiraceae bacterium]
MLVCEGLKKTYQGKCVVDGLSFEVKKGEVFALLGSNGAGKTTTIKMILGLVRIDEGKVEIEDGVKVGYSPETPYFPPFLSGREVLWYYGRIQGMGKEELKKEISYLLELVGLDEDRTKIKQYSKGMLQRLALAQALLGDPELLILDEPTAGLDALGRAEMMGLIKRLKEEGRTIVVNSHILSDMERVCDRGIIMKNGKLLRTWTKSELGHEETLEQLFLLTVGGVA